MRERGRSTRAPCDVPVTWRRRKLVVASMRDVSAHGLFLLTPQSVGLNQVMNLVVTLPDGPIEFFGVSRYVGESKQGHGIGVSIHTMSTEEKSRWCSFHRTAAVTRYPATRRAPDATPAR